MVVETGIYTLTIDLNVLNHLGIGLYSNIPAVVSEVVSNSYDADASEVRITIDAATKTIVITDDGWGMTREDINNKYLTVGYSKREREKDQLITPKGRHPMGRKGIGKLSLFSIANTIEVHSIKVDEQGIAHRNAFVMDAEEIKRAANHNEPYHPEPVSEDTITIDKGTQIILRDVKLGTATEAFLRKRLARRFSIIGAEYDFAVIVNDRPITLEDRDYFGKVEYLWHIGEGSDKYISYCPNSKKQTAIDGIVDEENGYRISGWIGTFDTQSSIDDGNNTIVILAWGKLIHEDLLKDMNEAGIYAKYLIGEIRADFLDADDKDDIATSDRQSLKEDDPRFRKLKEYVRERILKPIQSQWTQLRKENAEQEARRNPAVDEWFQGLEPDNQRWAKLLFEKIESVPIPDPQYKRELYRHGILAFETLALKQNLGALEQITSPEEFERLKSVFSALDSLEMIRYYQILKARLAVLEKFEQIVDSNAKEKVIQDHLFDHPWLLDPSWERASTDLRKEQSIATAFRGIDAGLTQEELDGRVDIRYQSVAGKHVIIELKRYNRLVDVLVLADQVRKYQSALQKCLQAKYPDDHSEIEVICILGAPPTPQEKDEQNRGVLAQYNARYMTYDQLISATQTSYRDYIEAQEKIKQFEELVDRI